MYLDKIAILSSVRFTRIPGFDNSATQGADQICLNLANELSYTFNNIQLIQNYTTKERVLNSLKDAAKTLRPGGLCLFYFHGHGISLPNQFDADNELMDQALVCYDGLIFDDELDQILRTFHPSQRIFTIIDSCNSETIVEWNYENTIDYPQIIHLAAAADNEIALATGLGGLMSSKILNSIYGYGYSNYTFLSFCKRIKELNNSTVFRFTKDISSTYLNSKLFT